MFTYQITRICHHRTHELEKGAYFLKLSHPLFIKIRLYSIGISRIIIRAKCEILSFSKVSYVVHELKCCRILSNRISSS